MKDDLSLLSDEQNLKSDELSSVGLFFVLLYVVLCVIAFCYYLECGTNYFCRERGYLVLLTYPWSLLLDALFYSARIAIEPEPAGFFYIDEGKPTWRTILCSYLSIVIGLLLNSVFLFLIGEKLQRLFGKRK